MTRNGRILCGVLASLGVLILVASLSYRHLYLTVASFILVPVGAIAWAIYVFKAALPDLGYSSSPRLGEQTQESTVRSDFHPTFSETGGARIDSFNATFPFATLSASS